MDLIEEVTTATNAVTKIEQAVDDFNRESFRNLTVVKKQFDRAAK